MKFAVSALLPSFPGAVVTSLHADITPWGSDSCPRSDESPTSSATIAAIAASCFAMKCNPRESPRTTRACHSRSATARTTTTWRRSGMRQTTPRARAICWPVPKRRRWKGASGPLFNC